MSVIKCPECGNPVSDRAKTCPHCGVDIAGEITTCPDCGEVIFKDALECPNCHCPINGAGVPASPMMPLVSVTPEVAEQEDEPAEKEAEPKKKKPRRGYAAFVVALVIALIIVLLGLYLYQQTQAQNELRAYQNALTSGEPAVLDNFLAVYTDASKEHTDSIKARLEELKKIDLEWEECLAGNKRDAFARYVKNHPGNVHVTEANLKIDSLDYVAAQQANTAEAYQSYLDAHADGYYYDEAKQRFEQLDALRLKAEEREAVASAIQRMLNAFAARDAAALRNVLSSPVVSFMGKANPAEDYPAQWMGKLFESDVTAIRFVPADDWKLAKVAPSQPESPVVYTVSVTVDERLDRSDASRERTASYQLSAILLPDYRVQKVQMQKVKK